MEAKATYAEFIDIIFETGHYSFCPVIRMKTSRSSGFSLIEIMVVVTVIGILALIGIPSIQTARQKAAATVTANDLRVFTDAVEFYISAEGSYPAFMTYTNMPDDIEEYLPPEWKNGDYSWTYRNWGQRALLLVYNLSFTAEQTIRVDSILDDGNIGRGSVRSFQGGIAYIFRN